MKFLDIIKNFQSKISNKFLINHFYLIECIIKDERWAQAEKQSKLKGKMSKHVANLLCLSQAYLIMIGRDRVPQDIDYGGVYFFT